MSDSWAHGDIVEILEYAQKSWTFEGEERDILSRAKHEILELRSQRGRWYKAAGERQDDLNKALDRIKELEKTIQGFVDAFKWSANVSKPNEGSWNRSQLDRTLNAWRENQYEESADSSAQNAENKT